MTKPSEAMVLWRAAVPSQIAVEHFLSKESRSRLSELTEFRLSDVLLEVTKTKLPTNEELFASLQAAFDSSKPDIDERLVLLTERRSAILRQVQEGTMKVLAFESPRALSSMPVEVPAPAICDARVSWDKGELAWQSVNFVEVRFLGANVAEQILVDWRTGINVADTGADSRQHEEYVIGAPSQRRKPGRPNDISKQVRAAVKNLMENNRIDLQAPIKPQNYPIRDWLFENFPDMEVSAKKPSDEVIRIAIKNYRTAHKL